MGSGILLVADNEHNTEPIVLTILSHRGENSRDEYEGYRVEHVFNTFQGLSKLSKKRFEAVILSYNQGAGDLLESYKIISREYPCIPVIAVTDDTESKGVAEAFRTGLQECLSPDGLTRKVLIRAIKSSVARKYSEIRFQKREEALFHSKKMDAVGRLANGISHDFNNLLSVISGYTDMAIVRAGDDKKQLKYLNAVADAARKASLLTKRLLLFGRKRESSPSVIDLDKSLSEMEQMILRLISEDMDLSFEKDPGKKMILMDNSQLEQVVVNLVINARDSIQDARGSVVIKTELRRESRNKRVVLLSITDNGVGIPDEALDKIFEPFYSTKEGERGTGMGLFVIYSIIKSNNGDIQVESEPGRGTTFRITFPYTEKA